MKKHFIIKGLKDYSCEYDKNQDQEIYIMTCTGDYCISFYKDNCTNGLFDVHVYRSFFSAQEFSLFAQILHDLNANPDKPKSPLLQERIKEN